jgi:hypothetical protein
MDRTPHGVRSPVAHRTINKSSVAGVGFNYHVLFPPSPFLSPFSSPYRRIPVFCPLFSPFFLFTTKFVFRHRVATSNHSLAAQVPSPSRDLQPLPSRAPFHYDIPESRQWGQCCRLGRNSARSAFPLHRPLCLRISSLVLHCLQATPIARNLTM